MRILIECNYKLKKEKNVYCDVYFLKRKTMKENLYWLYIQYCNS